MKRIIFAVVLLLIISCSNETAYSAFKTFAAPGTYVVEKQSMRDPNIWDRVVIVFGFADDYSASKDIAEYLGKDGGNYRCVPLK